MEPSSGPVVVCSGCEWGVGDRERGSVAGARRAVQTQAVLETLLRAQGDELYGLDLIRDPGVPPGRCTR